MRRFYKDVNNEPRVLEFVESKPYFMKWHHYFPAGQQEVWKTEDGSLVHIPANVWLLFVKDWRDEE